MEDRARKRMCTSTTSINSLDDACLMHIFALLAPLPDRFNVAQVCCRWRNLACDQRLWLRVKMSEGSISKPGVYSNIEDAVVAARPGDTILISQGGSHLACNVQITKPLCLVGGGSSPDETVVICPKGFDSAFEFMTTGKVTNLLIKAELGNCLIHRNGCLLIDKCVLQCEEHPLDYLCCPIVTTADVLPSGSFPLFGKKNSMSVTDTRIEGGAKAVITKGDLALQKVRVICAQTALFFWFDVSQKCLTDVDISPFHCQA